MSLMLSTIISDVNKRHTELLFVLIFFEQNSLMMFFSGLVITSYIFDLSEMFDFCFERHSVVKSYGVLFYGFLIHRVYIFFNIKSTMFTLCLCLKLILTHYRYIWCFIVYAFYGCFFDGHVR